MWIGDALNAIASGSPLLLVLEDLQWADPFTVDLISAVARSRTPAELMLVCTYRQVDVAITGHPMKALKPDLLIHHLCREIALKPLGEVAQPDIRFRVQPRGLRFTSGLRSILKWA
jgi:predicted ATPase